MCDFTVDESREIWATESIQVIRGGLGCAISPQETLIEEEAAL
jgi:hypothetical protein